MKIQICPIGIKAEIVDLENVGPCYPDDDIIYFDGKPYVLHTAQPVIEVTDKQIDDLAGRWFFGIHVCGIEELKGLRALFREWLTGNQPLTPNP